MRAHHRRSVAIGLLVAAVFVNRCATPIDEVPDDSAEPSVRVESRAEAGIDLDRKLMLLIDAGEHSAALALLEESTARPFDENTTLLFAGLLIGEGEFERARDELEEIDTHSAEARVLLAELENEPHERKAGFEHALELDASNADAHAGLGLYYLGDGDTQAASDHFAVALEGEPGHTAALRGMARIALSDGDIDRAVELLERAVDRDPDAGYLRAELAQAHMRAGNEGAAIESFTAASELEPHYAWHYVDRGRIHQRADRQEKAASDFSRAIELENRIFLFYFYRAESRYVLEEYRGALSDLERVLELEPRYRDAYPLIAPLYFRFERFSDAARYFLRSYETLGGDPSFALLAGLSYLRAGDDGRAESVFRHVEGSASRSSLYYDMAREYISPRNDNRTEQLIRREANPDMQTRMRFHLGALYHMQGRDRAAEALFLQVRDAGDTGFVESELAEVYLESFDGPRSAN